MRNDLSDNPIAVIGIGIDFPDARDPETFWQNLMAGKCSVRHFTHEEMQASGCASEEYLSPGYVPCKSVLNDTFGFDPAFFQIAEKEAKQMDPAHRLFLRTAWQAFENAGYVPGADLGAVGVYAGVAESSYLLTHLMGQDGLLKKMGKTQAKIACDKDFLATRVSYKLDLRGPSVTVQTSCSTGLVALHLACQSLLSEETDLAIAGAASIQFPLLSGYQYKEHSIYSQDGVCRPYDAGANGTVFGDGVAAVLLKRYEDAVADGDHIWAVIDATAVNNDGADKPGYAAPSVEGQARVIQEAMTIAGVTPDDIDLIEGHGTGTTLGDPVEVQALLSVLGQRDFTQNGPVYLGSVKANIGHLNTCAGMAGFIKACLAVYHQTMPGTPNYSQPNPLLPATDREITIPTRPVSLPQSAGQALVAGVSSFGIGGTNAHAILSAPGVKPEKWQAPSSGLLLPVSGKSPTSLGRMLDSLVQVLQTKQLSPQDIAFTLREGRKVFEHRAVIIITGQGHRVISADKKASAVKRVLIEVDGTDRHSDLLDDLQSACDTVEWIGQNHAERPLPGVLTSSDISVTMSGCEETDQYGRPVLYATINENAQMHADERLIALARLWCLGVNVDWQQINPLHSGKRVPLPGYDFDDTPHLVPLLPPLENKAPVPCEATLGGSLLDVINAGFCEVLGVESLAADDDFFSLGGDSMTALNLVDYLEQHLSQAVPFELVMRHSTPGRLSEALAPIVPQDAPLQDEPVLLQDLALSFGSIPRQSALPEKSFSGQNGWILLTGVTGFLGRRVLEEIITSSNCRVACIVRDAERTAQQRFDDLLLQAGVDKNAVADRLYLVKGDLSQPGLALSQQDRDFITQNVQRIIHIGSEVNWAYDYQQLRQTNTLATRELLDMALNGNCQCFAYVSSVAVFDSAHYPDAMCYQETHALRGIERLYTGYAQSKAVSEVMVSDAAAAGLSTAIFRPAYIVGDSRTGQFNANDFVYSALKAMLQLGIAPDTAYRLSITPVDQVAKGLWLAISGSATLSGVYHLLNSTPVYLNDIIDRLNAIEHRIKRVPPEIFYQQLVQAAKNRLIDNLRPFIDYFKPPTHQSGWMSPDGRTGFGKVYDCRRLQDIASVKGEEHAFSDAWFAQTLRLLLSEMGDVKRPPIAY